MKLYFQAIKEFYWLWKSLYKIKLEKYSRIILRQTFDMKFFDVYCAVLHLTELEINFHPFSQSATISQLNSSSYLAFFRLIAYNDANRSSIF